MLEILGTVFGSIFAGGATGIIGVIAQRYADYKNKQLDIELQGKKFEHEAVMRDKDAAIMREEWAGRTRVAETEAAGKEAVADAQAFAASFQLEPARFSEKVKPTRGQSWVLVLLDAVKTLIRPVLTVYLCILTTLIYQQAQELMETYGQALSAALAEKTLVMVIGTVLYLTTTCVLWWFGTRNKGQAPTY